VEGVGVIETEMGWDRKNKEEVVRSEESGRLGLDVRLEMEYIFCKFEAYEQLFSFTLKTG
jgi:hypothetical protein